MIHHQLKNALSDIGLKTVTGPLARRLAIIAGLVYVLPFVFTSSFERLILTLLCINIIAVIGFDLLFGYTGLLSLGQAGFWGIGAYTSAILMVDYGYPFIISFPLAILVVLAIGTLIGYVATRFDGVFFIIFTLVFGLMVQTLINNLEWLTHGTGGIPGVPNASITLPFIGEFVFASTLDFFYLSGGLVIVGLLIKWWLVESKFGDVLLAIKEDELLAESLGVSPVRYKIASFSIAAGYAAASGVLYAHLLNYIGPGDVSMFHSMDIFVMSLLGGTGTFAGQIVGPLLITILDEVLRAIDPNLARITFGALLILLVIYLPDGLVGTIRKKYDSIKGGKE